jgi:hypothetical protein
LGSPLTPARSSLRLWAYSLTLCFAISLSLHVLKTLPGRYLLSPVSSLLSLSFAACRSSPRTKASTSRFRSPEVRARTHARHTIDDLCAKPAYSREAAADSIDYIVDLRPQVDRAGGTSSTAYCGINDLSHYLRPKSCLKAYSRLTPVYPPAAAGPGDQVRCTSAVQ